MMENRGFASSHPPDDRTIVVIFLRGGADGLTLVPPVGDDAYHRVRPTLRVRAEGADQLSELFALHPRLGALLPLYRSGELAIVHAVGSEDATRSHFEAQDLMEHAGTFGGGWLGRFLRFRRSPHGALSAIAWGTELPAALRGAPAATVMESLGVFSLGDGARGMAVALRTLYGLERNALGVAAADTLHALERLERLPAAPRSLISGVDYPRDDFGNALQQTAMLIKAGVGLEAATLDLGGWDSHLAQATTLPPLMERLANGLTAFRRDLGVDMSRTTVVVMTEFGRRVAENSSFGTDHGRGSVMFALGGGVHGGRVLGAWPGLGAEILDGPGDLPVRTNYRNVLAPIISRLGGADVVAKAFPGFLAEPLELFG